MDGQAQSEAVEALGRALEGAGASLTLELPGRPALRIGRRPETARVIFRTVAPLAHLAAQDHLALAESYLAGEIDLEGDVLEVMKVTEVIAPHPSLWARLVLGARLLLRGRRAEQRDAISFHYDRPPEFFLPWFERWRSYSHGIYASPDDPPADAQARKLALAVERLDLKPGDRVFDMGCGWGSFMEYAGLQGIHVHGITISREQRAFVSDLIRERGLPCSVEQVDFLDFRPQQRFRAAVFMGTFEHFGDYGHAARFLARWLEPGGRVWADFCTARGVKQGGAFLKKHVWPGGTTSYVDVPKLLRAFEAEGFNVHELVDDTRSYALTVRDWSQAFERERTGLEARFGREPVRAFHLFLRASEYFLASNRTQAYHLVAGLEARPLRVAGS